MSAPGESFGDGHRQDVVADDRAQRDCVVGEFAPQIDDGPLQPLHGAAAEPGPRRRHPDPLTEPFDEPAGRLRVPFDEDAGEADRPLEEAARGGRREQREHRRAPGRLTGEGDPARITAERADVLLDPVEREQQIPQPEVGGYVVQRGESVDAQPVADGDTDDAVPGERAAVVPRARRAAPEEAAAVDPHQHRAGRRVTGDLGGSDDGEVQDVVTGHRRLRHRGRGEQGHALRGGPVPGRVERLREPVASQRRREPPYAGRWLGVRDAEEPLDGAGATADDRAGGGVDGDRTTGDAVDVLHGSHRIPDPEMPCTK